jgi:hypothetical protein
MNIFIFLKSTTFKLKAKGKYILHSKKEKKMGKHIYIYIYSNVSSATNVHILYNKTDVEIIFTIKKLKKKNHFHVSIIIQSV